MTKVVKRMILFILSGIWAILFGLLIRENEPQLLYFLIAVVPFGVCFILYITALVNPQKESRKCRLCGKPGPMAITNEKDGLCKDCLLEVVNIPGVLKEREDKK